MGLLEKIRAHAKQVVLGTSCSLLHVPCTLRHETKLDGRYTQYFALAKEKLCELSELKAILSSDCPRRHQAILKNEDLFAKPREGENPAVKKRVEKLKYEWNNRTLLAHFRQDLKIEFEQVNEFLRICSMNTILSGK